MTARAETAQDPVLLAKVCNALNKRGQNFIHGDVAGEFRMLQADYGPLPGEGVVFTGMVLAIVVKDWQAKVFVYPDPGHSPELRAPLPASAWTAFSVDLAGLGATAMTNQLHRALLEMHGIERVSGMAAVAS
jgi:hypothetical protein